MLKAILGMTLIIIVLLAGIFVFLNMIVNRMTKKKPVYRSYHPRTDPWDNTRVQHIYHYPQRHPHPDHVSNPAYNYGTENSAIILARLRDARAEVVRLQSQVEEKCKKLGTLDWQNRNLRNEIEKLKKTSLELSESKDETALWVER